MELAQTADEGEGGQGQQGGLRGKVIWTTSLPSAARQREESGAGSGMRLMMIYELIVLT